MGTAAASARHRTLVGVQGHLNHLGQVNALAAGALFDLGPATEPVGHDERVLVGIPDLGKDDSLPCRLGHAVLLASLEPEAAGHPATAGVRDTVVEAEAVE